MKFKSKFDEKVIVDAVRRMIAEPVDLEVLDGFSAWSVSFQRHSRVASRALYITRLAESNRM